MGKLLAAGNGREEEQEFTDSFIHSFTGKYLSDFSL